MAISVGMREVGGSDGVLGMIVTDILEMMGNGVVICS